MLLAPSRDNNTRRLTEVLPVCTDVGLAPLSSPIAWTDTNDRRNRICNKSNDDDHGQTHRTICRVDGVADLRRDSREAKNKKKTTFPPEEEKKW